MLEPDQNQYYGTAFKFPRFAHALGVMGCAALCGIVPIARADHANEFALTSPHATSWSVEIESGGLWSNVRDSKLADYTLVPFGLSFTQPFGGTLLKEFAGGIFVGRPEVYERAYGTLLSGGPESFIVGGSVGLRYYFTGLGGRWQPFADMNVGAAYADAHPYVENGESYGLGQDFNFNFGLGLGVRFDFTERWYGRVTAVYTHYSNAGLSLPEHSNKAIDGVGFLVGVGWRF